MRIGILTNYDVNNQGAQLQLYAMYKQLELLGHTPIVLTYRKNYDFMPDQELRNQITLRSIPYIIKNFIIKKGLALTWHNTRKYLINKRFREQTFNHQPYCRANMDAAIVGADEVFGLQEGVNMMMFGHGVSSDNMIAYAPSSGQTNMQRIEQVHCKELIKSGLGRFIRLSARDEQTRSIITTLTNTECPIVCDPVLLYRFPLDEYKQPANTPKKRYLVIYSYDARFIEPSEIEAIRHYAKLNDLITVSPGTFHSWCDKNIVCNAIDWLKIISQATAVITDTFHGTLASVITNRPVAISYSKTVNSSKMLDIISRLCLDDRLLSSVTFDEINRVLSTEMDMNALNDRVESFRSVSIKYFKEALLAVYDK